MRVIAGQYRSRRLVAPPGAATRPTSDRLRETLFNVLGSRLEGARFADLYAGSGAVGVEALSRGAAHVLFVETAAGALAALRKNVASLGLEHQVAISTRPVGRALSEVSRSTAALDIVFVDPPYEAADEYRETLLALGAPSCRMLAPGAIIVAEHARRHPLPESFGLLKRTRLLEQGDAALSFYGRDDETA